MTFNQDFRSFIPTQQNAVVVQSLRRLCRSTSYKTRPVLLLAASGLGKSHLLKAMQAEISALLRTRCHRIAFEEFGRNRVTGSIQTDDALLEKYSGAVSVLVDDCNLFEPGRSSAYSQSWLNLFARLNQSGTRIVVASLRCPESRRFRNAWLRSIPGSRVMTLSPPTMAVRRRIVANKSTQKGLVLTDAELTDIANCFDPSGDVRSIEREVLKRAFAQKLISNI